MTYGSLDRLYSTKVTFLYGDDEIIIRGVLCELFPVEVECEEFAVALCPCNVLQVIHAKVRLLDEFNREVAFEGFRLLIGLCPFHLFQSESVIILL